jgi:predicted negative regulator of RcsB-dependent stress response
VIAEVLVDDYLTEKEQIEVIKRWWNENGWYLIGGVAIAVLGYVGYGQYQDYRDRRNEEAAGLYLQLAEALADDRGRSDELLTQLREEHPGSPYTHQAGLLIAKEYLVSDTARAESELRHVMAESSDPGLAFIARLRLTRVLIYRENYEEALQLLEVDDPGEFAARLNELKGDVHTAMGDIEAARSAYAQALTAPGAESVDRNFVQMKLNSLQAPPGSGAAEGGA